MSIESSEQHLPFYNAAKRVLLTGGRAPAALELARLLAGAGHKVYMAESCSAQLCLRSKAVAKSYKTPKPSEEPEAYLATLKTIIDMQKIDWLIPTCEEIFYISRGIDKLSEHCFVFTESLDKLRTLHSKWEFMHKMEEKGFLVPVTHLLSTKEQVEKVLELPGKWVFKPVFSRFSAKVFFVERSSLTEKQAHTLFCGALKGLSNEQPWVAQQFIKGTAFCSYSIAHRGVNTAHVVYPVSFTAGRGAAISFESVCHPEIDRFVEQFVATEQFTGQIAFDFIQSETTKQLYPIECNPRLTSGIHLFQVEDRIDHAFFAIKQLGGDELEPVKREGELKKQPIFPILPEYQRKAVTGLAMLFYGLGSIRSPAEIKHWIMLMSSGRDTIFRLRDIQPFFQQFALLWWSFRVSREKRVAIEEAATLDIEWNGGE